MVKVDHRLIVGGSSWVVKVAHGEAWWIIVEYNGSDVEQGGSWWSMVDHNGSWWVIVDHRGSSWFMVVPERRRLSQGATRRHRLGPEAG